MLVYIAICVAVLFVALCFWLVFDAKKFDSTVKEIIEIKKSGVIKISSAVLKGAEPTMIIKNGFRNWTISADNNDGAEYVQIKLKDVENYFSNIKKFACMKQGDMYFKSENGRWVKNKRCYSAIEPVYMEV